jgi:hypothetical protein
MIENPQPSWMPALLLALPGIGFAAYAVNQIIFPNDARPFCTIPAIGLVLALLPTHVLALVLGSLSIGLAVAWTVVGVAGYGWVANHWREFRSALSTEEVDGVRRLAIAGLATLPIVVPTVLANFTDEANFNGHDAIIAHLQNGTYPPRYLYEPSLPLRYHYAFDLAGAIVTGLLRVRLDHAIDFLTLALWPCMFLLFWRLGEYVGGRRAGLFVAIAVCFAGGWPLLAAPGLLTVDGLRVNPPFIHYYFQHPWSLGVPIFCLIALQRASLPRLPNRMLGLAALICSLLLLSLAHAVLFISTVVALGMTEAWRFVRTHDRQAGTMLFALSASLVGAKLIGGFFVSGSFPPSGGIFGTGFSFVHWTGGDAALGQVQWNFASFGILPLLGFIGLRRARQEKEFLTILGALSLIVVNMLRYKYSWDIVKFGTVGFIALAIGTGIVISDLAAWADTFGRRFAYTVLIVSVASQGALFPYLLTIGSYNPESRRPFSMELIRPYFSLNYPVNFDDAQAVNFLRNHMAPSEIVYRAEPKSEPYAIWGGLPTQVSVYFEEGDHDDVYGFGEEKLAARIDLARISEDWLDRLAAQHVKWLVTDADDGAINAILERPEGQRTAVLAAQYGNVRVFRLL